MKLNKEVHKMTAYYKYEEVDTLPKITQYLTFDYLWLNFYDKDATAYSMLTDFGQKMKKS